MGLGGWLQDLLPESGTNTDQVRPVNEGEMVTVVPNQNQESSLWGVLDDLGTTIQNGVGDYARTKVQHEINRISLGSEASLDTTGDPNDQVGQNYIAPAPETSFIKKYQKELLLGGGALIALVVVSKAL